MKVYLGTSDFHQIEVPENKLVCFRVMNEFEKKEMQHLVVSTPFRADTIEKVIRIDEKQTIKQSDYFTAQRLEYSYDCLRCADWLQYDEGLECMSRRMLSTWYAAIRRNRYDEPIIKEVDEDTLGVIATHGMMKPNDFLHVLNDSARFGCEAVLSAVVGFMTKRHPFFNTFLIKSRAISFALNAEKINSAFIIMDAYVEYDLIGKFVRYHQHTPFEIAKACGQLEAFKERYPSAVVEAHLERPWWFK